MGYTTLKGGKIVIWTNKIFVADDYPWQDMSESWTYFYKNLKGASIGHCLARESDEYKRNFVAHIIGVVPDKIVLKSRKSHFMQMAKRNV